MSDTRLSMLHLKIAEQESDEKLREGYIQLIPLTPGTSFQMTNGGGTVQERALMFAILTRVPEIAVHRDELERFFIYYAEGAWTSWAKDWYENKVKTCEKKTQGTYPASVISSIYEYDQERPILAKLVEHLSKRESGTSPYKDAVILNALRVMFARISTGMLNPDLVIMDEFQRFKFLLNSDQESETGILAQKFLGGGDTRILLLSATPYKLYSTLEEIDEAQVDEHYSEFLQVMDFLFAGHSGEFHRVWADYSIALHEMSAGSTAILQVKNAAEDAMYSGVCRLDWRGFKSNDQFENAVSWLCTEVLPLGEVDIPEDERLLPSLPTTADEMRHNLLLQYFRQYLDDRGVIYQAALMNLKNTSLHPFLIAQALFYSGWAFARKVDCIGGYHGHIDYG